MADLEKKEAEVATAAKKEKTKKAAPKKDKVGFGKKIGKFFKDYKSELKKIVWLSPKMTFQYTGMVLVVIVLVSAFIGVLDITFKTLLDFVAGLV